MNVDLGIWSKLNRLVVFLLFVAAIVAVAVWYLPLINQNERLRKKILQRESQIQKAEEEKKHLRTSIDALLYDPKAVERLARERLGYAKPGETIIRFEESATNAPPRR